MSSAGAKREPRETSLRLMQGWSRRSLRRLTPLTGEEGARRLVDALISECVGRRLDEVASAPLLNGSRLRYPELREFFQRFAPEVVHYLPRNGVPAPSVERLEEIIRAICARIAADFPATLGRYGRTLLAHEWKTLEAELPRRMEASWSLAHTAGGEAVESLCRSELEALLARELVGLRDAKALLELRRATRQTLCWRALDWDEDY